jgi:hypothetical protein
MPKSAPRKPAPRRRGKRIVGTAYHEAGHVVAHICLGSGFNYVTIKPDKDDDSLGHVARGRYPAWFDPENDKSDRARLFAEKRILSCLAGDAAEARWRGRHNWQGMRSDFHELANLTSYFCGAGGEEEAAYIKWLLIRARNLITRPQNWCQVKAVARALVKRGRLSRRECRRISCEAINRRAIKGFTGCASCTMSFCEHAGRRTPRSGLNARTSRP